jgi:PPOX class probable F420-dependent enzyme
MAASFDPPFDPPFDPSVTPELLAFIGERGHGVLTTIKKDGRPQLSVVGYAFDAGTATFRVSLTDSRAKTRNLRRDPRCSILVTTPANRPYAVAEGTAELTAVTTDPHDAAADALVDLYRAIAGEHPDWDEYRAAMVADGRLVLSLRIERAYGFA